MANDQYTQFVTDAKQYETILIIGMIRIEEYDRLFIIEGRLSFLKGNTVLLDIYFVLPIIPSEFHFYHMYNVRMCEADVKRLSRRDVDVRMPRL